jgi:hypothetical protein
MKEDELNEYGDLVAEATFVCEACPDVDALKTICSAMLEIDDVGLDVCSLLLRTLLLVATDQVASLSAGGYFTWGWWLSLMSPPKRSLFTISSTPISRFLGSFFMSMNFNTFVVFSGSRLWRVCTAHSVS